MAVFQSAVIQKCTDATDQETGSMGYELLNFTGEAYKV